jgi:hypothetical protein
MAKRVWKLLVLDLPSYGLERLHVLKWCTEYWCHTLCSSLARRFRGLIQTGLSAGQIGLDRIESQPISSKLNLVDDGTLRLAISVLDGLCLAARTP